MNDLLSSLVYYAKEIFLTVTICIIATLICFLVRTSCVKNAKMINETYGTTYTASDMLWHGEMINQIIIVSKTRVLLENVSKK